MAEEVKLPALGESVEEGVITAWLVEVGDEVEVDQPLVEISTDKVDTEVPSPVAGVVQELRAEVDDTIAVGETLAVVGEGEAGGGGDDADDEGGAEQDEEPEAAEDDGGDEGAGAEEAEQEATESATSAAAPEETSEAAEDSQVRGDDTDESSSEPSHAGGASAATPAQPPTSAGGGDGAGSKALASPLVRRLLREAGISPDQVEGTGQGGRITREDAERAIEQGVEEPAEAPAKEPKEAAPAEEAQRPAARAATSGAPPPAPPSAPSPAERPEPSPHQVDFGGEQELVQDLTRVRKAIAKAMYNSMQSTAQLTAAVEVDMTPVMNLRARAKDAFKQQHGASLSPLPIVARAACMTIPRHPDVNASIDVEGGTATYHNYINLGMAVDTERGLLVPNIKHAEDLNIPGLAKRIVDIAGKARSGKGLSPDDIQGGTFTITNTGSRGTLWDTPILNPPEVAILATCSIEKRAVVVSDELGDSIAIRQMMYLCLTYDHRMLDGADAARFLQDLKWVIENHDFAGELNL